ncbi:MAG: hypothetical protein HND50_10195 [Calditrichaeota bacterium]|nr:hypothetical protein [Calditrichota bacterium]
MVFKYSKFFMILALALFMIAPNKTQAQLKYNNGFTISSGIYSASGFGTNPYVGFRYNHYLNQGKHFVEASFGVSSMESDVLKTVANARLFESNRLLVYQFVYGYDPKMWTSFPYLTAGVAGINQGGQSKFALVAGMGNRLYFDTIFGSKKIGLRYDLRDQILKQRFNDKKSFFAHNLVFTLNLEFFY